MRPPACLVVVAAATVAATASAQQASPPPPPAASAPVPADAALREEVARQATAIEELRESLAAEKEERLHPRVRVSGFIQIDWVIHNEESQDEINGSNGQLLNQDRFTLRRGHVRLDAEQWIFSSVLEIDANTTSGAQVRPIEASVSARWPLKPDERLPTLTASLGLMRIPWGFEVQELDYVRPFLERATMNTALFPGEYDLGMRFKAKYRFLDAAVAVMNGNPIGSKEFPDLDPIQTKDLVGRLGVDFEVAPGIRLAWGVSADTGTGFHPGTPATKPQLIWQDQNGDGLVEPNEITAVGGSPATPSQQFHRFGLGGDAHLSVRIAPLGDLTFRTEVVSAVNLDRGLEVADPIAAGHDLREQGWSGGATQEITRWAMIGARYDVYNPDGDATQQRAFNLVPIDRAYSTLALMGMFRYGQQRLLLEYDINHNPLGIGPNGAPTSLAANALTLRGQMVF